MRTSTATKPPLTEKQLIQKWVKKFKLSSILCFQDLEGLSIRQLKALTAKVNKDLGAGAISKARFGADYSSMTQAQLKQAIWYCREVQLDRVRGCSFELFSLSPRIFGFRVDGDISTKIIYVGFNSSPGVKGLHQATQFHSWLLKNNDCRLATIRKADRLKGQYEYEVKVWGIGQGYLSSLVNKDLVEANALVA